jgi:hypothetical protein
MLGVYEGFPATVHKIMHFRISISNRSLQQKLVKSLHALNKQAFSLEKLADLSVPGFQAVFEFGIAEADGFNYLNEDETRGALKAIVKKPLQTMDLFCVVRCHRSVSEKRASLKFDYFMIRFMFNEGLMDAYAFHERGPRYTSPEDIINVIVNKVNGTCSKKVLTEVF